MKKELKILLLNEAEKEEKGKKENEQKPEKDKN